MNSSAEKSRTITLIFFLLALSCSLQLQAQVTFQGTPLISMPSTPQELAKGDFNNDGRMDFVGVNFNGLANQQVTILLNSGSGTFSGSNKRNFASRQNTLDVAVGDFNEDGNLDVVTISQESSNAFSLLLGDGAGNLAAPVFFNAGSTPQGIAVGDMNKDGNLDVLVTNRGTPEDVYIYLGNGSGNFSAPTIITIANVWDITVADFNNDTNPDFAVYVGNTVQVWFGNGTGTAYTLGPTITSFGISANPITSADLDGDGDFDILASSGYTLNDGSGNFSARIVLSQTGSVYRVADLNNDSHPDIIANDHNQNTPNMRVLLGDGSGTFTLLAKFEIRGYANGIEVADVNNDGNPDIVSIGAWGGVPVADVLLGDGTGYFTNAPVKYPTVTDPRDIVKGDFNEDGEIDFALTHASNIVTIYLGQGNGRFAKTATNYATGALPQYILAFDYNKDNHLDLVTLNWNGASLTVLTGAGNGSFSLLANIPVTALSGSRLTMADFNNDTFIDIAVSGYTNNLISILTGTGSGFNAPVTFPTSDNVSEIKAADFTGDGNQDIIADFNNINRMVLFTGNGSGGFTEGTTQYVQNGSFFLVDDINGDAKPDIITFSNSSGDDYFINDGIGNFTGSAMSVSLGGFPWGYEDMNGDGIKDLLAGSQGTNTSSPGQIVVFRGTVGGISNSVLIDKDYSGGNRFILHDLNNDGRTDIIATSNNLYEDYVGTLINTTTSAGCPSIITQSPSASVCTGESFGFSVTASGSAPLAYQWQKNGVDIAGETTATITFLTIALTDAGTYTCRISNGCGSTISNNAVLTVLTTPAAPGATGATGCEGASVTLTATGGTNGQYRWYVLEEGIDAYGDPITEILLIAGQTNSTYTTPALTETTEFLVSISNGTCESNTTLVEAIVTNCNGTPPVITTQLLITQSGQSVTLDLVPLIIITNGILDLTSLQIMENPASGAVATINSSGVLTIDYSGIDFNGIESITIRACDTNGLCTEQVFTIEVNEGIEIYNAVSPNNDGKNDFFNIANINSLEPENKISIYNRWGSKVFEVENYSEENAFRGLNQNGNELPSGTYFYKILFKLTGKTQQGFLVLKR